MLIADTGHDGGDVAVLSVERLFWPPSGCMATTLPCRSWGKTDTGRIWNYVRDDPLFGGQSPPAALYYASRGWQQHSQRHLKTFTGILQADAYGGYNPLFKANRGPGPLTQALCWAHSRRKFLVLVDIATNAKRGKNAAPISALARGHQTDQRPVRYRARGALLLGRKGMAVRRIGSQVAIDCEECE